MVEDDNMNLKPYFVIMSLIIIVVITIAVLLGSRESSLSRGDTIEFNGDWVVVESVETDWFKGKEVGQSESRWYNLRTIKSFKKKK